MEKENPLSLETAHRNESEKLFMNLSGDKNIHQITALNGDWSHEVVNEALEMHATQNSAKNISTQTTHLRILSPNEYTLQSSSSEKIQNLPTYSIISNEYLMYAFCEIDSQNKHQRDSNYKNEYIPLLRKFESGTTNQFDLILNAHTTETILVIEGLDKLSKKDQERWGRHLDSLSDSTDRQIILLTQKEQRLTHVDSRRRASEPLFVHGYPVENIALNLGVSQKEAQDIYYMTGGDLELYHRLSTCRDQWTEIEKHLEPYFTKWNENERYLFDEATVYRRIDHFNLALHTNELKPNVTYTSDTLRRMSTASPILIWDKNKNAYAIPDEIRLPYEYALEMIDPEEYVLKHIKALKVYFASNNEYKNPSKNVPEILYHLEQIRRLSDHVPPEEKEFAEKYLEDDDEIQRQLKLRYLVINGKKDTTKNHIASIRESDADIKYLRELNQKK